MSTVLLTLGGAALIGVHAFARDDDGYYSTETEQLISDGYAVSTAEVDLAGDGNGFGVEDLGASLRVNAESVGGQPVFIGIASQDDAESADRPPRTSGSPAARAAASSGSSGSPTTGAGPRWR